jgi:hypothetical protein
MKLSQKYRPSSWQEVIGQGKKIDISTKKYPSTFAIVSDKDYERVSEYHWHAMSTGNRGVCASRRFRINKVRILQLMHRFILGIEKEDRLDVDHKNGNALDNRRKNLRICTKAQNMYNRRKQKTPCTSKYKGVSWRKTEKKWVVGIKFNRKSLNLGYYKNEIYAAKVYDKKAKELFGEFACLNFPKIESGCMLK